MAGKDNPAVPLFGGSQKYKAPKYQSKAPPPSRNDRYETAASGSANDRKENKDDDSGAANQDDDAGAGNQDDDSGFGAAVLGLLQLAFLASISSDTFYSTDRSIDEMISSIQPEGPPRQTKVKPGALSHPWILASTITDVITLLKKCIRYRNIQEEAVSYGRLIKLVGPGTSSYSPKAFKPSVGPDHFHPVLYTISSYSVMAANPREEQTPRPTDEDTTPTESSSIQITTRDDLSLLYRFVRTIIKPLRPKLASSSNQQPGGSIRLIPPHKEDLEVIESQVESVWQYTYQTKSSAASPQGHGARPAHQIYYFHGGGFQMRPSNQHRVFLRRLSRDLYRRSQTQVPNRPEPLLTLVSYPLAPHSPAHKSLPILQKWLSATLDNAVQSGDKVTLMGDSSGGNLALSLGFWASEHYKVPSAVAHFDSELGSKEGVPRNTRPKKSSPLVSIIAISPAVDLRNINPEIQQMDRLDPVLTAKLTGDVGQIWSTGSSSKKPSDTKPDDASLLSVDDPQLSPLLNSEDAFRGLASKDIQIHGVFGTFDVLSPDAKLFMQKCERYGVRGKWLVWEGQMHCFPLTAGKGIRGIREGREGLEWLEDVIMGD